MTVAEAAEILEVRTSTVYSLCRERLLGHQRVGAGRGTIRISRADLDAYVESIRVEAHDRPPRMAPRGTGLAVEDLIGKAMAERERKKLERERRQAEKQAKQASARPTR
jgi:excisionase family DNA binding protein